MDNMSIIRINKGEYEEAVSYVLQAYEIQERVGFPELQRSVDILGGIKEKLGSEAYERLVKKVQSQDLS